MGACFRAGGHTSLPLAVPTFPPPPLYYHQKKHNLFLPPPGYGTIAPSTAAGQILFMFYAIIGIPLALLFLTQIGKIIDAWVNRALKPVEKRWGATTSRAIGSISLFLVVLIFFILIPAAIYTGTETWNYRESVYFTLVTLTTVGFGDFVPAQSGLPTTNSITGLYKIITTAWLWLGLALVAALISEIQNLLESMGTWCHTNASCCAVARKTRQCEAGEARIGRSGECGSSK